MLNCLRSLSKQSELRSPSLAKAWLLFGERQSGVLCWREIPKIFTSSRCITKFNVLHKKQAMNCFVRTPDIQLVTQIYKTIFQTGERQDYLAVALTSTSTNNAYTRYIELHQKFSSLE